MAKTINNKSFSIEFAEKAFDQYGQRSSITNKTTKFDSTISQMNRSVEALDRFDDFNSLKIDSSNYQKTEDSPYGIPVNFEIQRNGSVILEHQRKAALSFLKELRGFGLLADVVGSGKTYEACVVLSELAVRNKIRSLLLVVPSQVYETWIKVLEQEFGLGVNQLKRVGSSLHLEQKEISKEGQFLVPIQPIIVKMEDFVSWGEDSANYLFDVIVVDEAHHLCQQEGKYAKAMKLLSLMMQTKKKAASTYCILLSATPHSGNLDNMFRLWYFIRCKGGNPSDFDVTDEKDCTKEYHTEKEYYQSHICRNASTVMEFIDNVKYIEVKENNQYKMIVSKYIAEIQERDDPESAELQKILMNRKMDELKKVELLPFINGAMYENEEFGESLKRRIASAYHNGVLRSIMIRQPKNPIGKKKSVVNILYYPTEKPIGILEVKGLDGVKVKVDCSQLYSDKAIYHKDTYKSLETYIEDVRGARKYSYTYASFLVNTILGSFNDMNNSQIFRKKSSAKYYATQFDECPKDIRNEVYPIPYKKDDFISHKLKKTIELLTKHQNERVLVFFDYDLKKEESVFDVVKQELSNIPSIKNRLLIGTEQYSDKVIESFNEKENAVLLVKTAAFTEGANLQKCSVIINFQVTPDPLAMDQRIGRIFRLGQSSDVVIYSLANMQELEGYVLMYFSRIGLLGSNFGDATIIAGSNNDRMVAVRCAACNSVKLYSQEEYEMKKKNDELYCTNSAACVQNDKKGTQMEEICVYDFKCEKCGSTFTRSVTEGGYRCISHNNTGSELMCNSGEANDRRMYCRKICVMAHCNRFESDLLKEKCKALKRYRQNKNASDAELMALCAQCSLEACPTSCRVGTGPKAITSCMRCRESQCTPKPHILNFNENWECDCPKCKENGQKGKIKPILARTFAAYICGAWNFNHDHGESFCPNLLEEAKKVSFIKDILEMDDRD